MVDQISLTDAETLQKRTRLEELELAEKATKESMKVYAITDRAWLGGRTLHDVTEEVLAAGATFLQIREKELDEATFLEEAKDLAQLAKKYHVPFVVNDNIDIALACGADGVHVGQSDIVDTVSYTHLDVYKRQGFIPVFAKNFLFYVPQVTEQANNCLLYTSTSLSFAPGKDAYTIGGVTEQIGAAPELKDSVLYAPSRIFTLYFLSLIHI